MRFIVMLLALVVLTLNGCSTDKIAVTESPAKVDLDQLVMTGEVAPVGGVTPAGQPDAAALRVFARNGYGAVIDLRTAGENRGLDEKAVVEDLGMTYVSMPIDRNGITFENARLLDKMLEGFEEPVLLHCGSSNRVGALLALRASLAGADDEEALQIGRRAGLTGLEPVVQEVLNAD